MTEVVVSVVKSDTVVIKNCPNCGMPSRLHSRRCWNCKWLFRTRFRVVYEPSQPINWLALFTLGLLAPVLVLLGFTLAQYQTTNTSRVVSVPVPQLYQQPSVVYYTATPVPTAVVVVVVPTQAPTVVPIIAPTYAAYVPLPTPIQLAPPMQVCDAAYPAVCIPLVNYDLDCPDIPFVNFPVSPPDPHRFDGDFDGIGCEQ